MFFSMLCTRIKVFTHKSHMAKPKFYYKKDQESGFLLEYLIQ